LIDGVEPDRDPLTQAKAVARRVREILKEQTGQDVPVKPVVLFPGWYVEVPTRNSEVYVANETWFMNSFDHEHARQRLDDTMVKLLAAGMEREGGSSMARGGGRLAIAPTLATLCPPVSRSMDAKKVSTTGGELCTTDNSDAGWKVPR